MGTYVGGTALEVRRDDLASSRLVAPRLAAGAGEVVLVVDEFALTANNITYARLGDAFGYWRFFPTADSSWGRVPAWGYATVAASDHPEVPVGQQVYGFVPMASHLVVRPARRRGDWFVDATPHRVDLAPAYNAYRFVHPGGDPALHALRPLLAPSFMLSFLLDAALVKQRLYGAARVLVTSASSKAAIGTAFLLRERGVATVGLTAPERLAFVASLGVYDDVVDYDAGDSLDATPTTLVDIAGDADLRHRLTARLGPAVRHSIEAGFTRTTAEGPAPVDGGPAAELFSAPDHIVARTREWGRAGFDERVEGALQRFAAWAHDWIDLVRTDDPRQVEQAFHLVRLGQVPPAGGMLLRLPSRTQGVDDQP